MDSAIDLLAYLVPVLEDLGLRYAVGGSVAAMAYGEPRMTRDVDVVVLLAPHDVPRLLQRFPAPEFYVDFQAAREAARDHTQFNIIHATSAYKIDIYIAGDPISRAQIERSRRLPSPAGFLVNFSAPEELIIKKMQAYAQGDTERHLRDVSGMLTSAREWIDVERVKRLADSTDLAHIWTAVEQRTRQS